MIDLNLTMLIQLINFIITLVLVNVLLVKPIRYTIQNRRKVLADGAASVESFAKKANSDLASYEERLQSARLQGETLRRELREQSIARQQQLLADAASSAQSNLAQSRVTSHQAALSAQQQLSGQVPQMAELALGKLLG